ncbi:Homeobox protein OTX1 [Mycena sanguinolenta]|uniref:Homeobox protein OTX1 n=1 Tax=Mycena sanguinolenta TaxID=230812 RepID=A0A8H6YLL3_9AGAR|nr:Homeobox protein OTX1 [Mycena sanguinolenta]
MLRQVGEFRTINIHGGVGGNGGRGGEQGGSGGVGEGPTTHFGVLNADTMHFVIQNHWMDYAPFQLMGVCSSEGASYETSGTSHNGGNIFNFHGVKRRREKTEDGSDSSLPTQRMEKRRRLNDDDECEVIPSRNLKLIREIGSGPGYLLHAGQNKGHAVIVKVFNRGPRSKVRRQLEATVALSKGIMHPNVLRLLGISSPESCSHFIVYENGKLSRLKLRVRLIDGESVHWQNAEGPLAMALKTDLKRSITIGFKMVAGLSAGLNHLLVQGVFAKPMGVENFDIFLDVDDRFVISVHPQSREEEGEIAQFQERESAWIVFNTLCGKTLTSANRVLHCEEISRDPTILDVGCATASEKSLPLLFPFGSSAPLQNTQEGLDVPPRREYVWRTIDRGWQSLENIARRINLDMNMDFSSLPKMNWTDQQSPHRCAGYMREEITLTTTILDSAVVAHDVPSPSERCLICNEVVDVREKFRCKCGDLAPGTRHTIKCQMCKFWSHSDCVENSNHKFLCRLCMRPEAPAEEEETWASGSPLLFGPRTPTEEEEDIDIETRTSGPPLLFDSRILTEDSEEEDMNNASTIRIPTISSHSLSRHGSSGLAFETAYEKPETSELSTVIDQETRQEGDTEEHEGMNPHSETSPPPVAPLKKRTRTLTTPHQSAVLHALLAQSRFPTTAVRGRGRTLHRTQCTESPSELSPPFVCFCSARSHTLMKIWFQHQRQKARRSGSQSDASSQPGPPYYTSFPNAPPSYPSAPEHTLEHAFSHGEREGRAIPHTYSGYPPSKQFLGSTEAPQQLLGPGMPSRAPQRVRPVLSSAPTDYSRGFPLPPFTSRSLR